MSILFSLFLEKNSQSFEKVHSDSTYSLRVENPATPGGWTIARMENLSASTAQTWWNKFFSGQWPNSGQLKKAARGGKYKFPK